MTTNESSEEFDFLTRCTRCRILLRNCICAAFPSSKISTSTRIVIFQDEGELKPSKQLISSVPLLRDCLENISIVTSLKCLPTTENIALLYPSDQSVVLSEDNPELMDIQTLIVLDGSWKTVQHMVSTNLFLQPRKCRHVRLDLCSEKNAGISAYESEGLRKEPHRAFVSTSEAVARALQILEPISQASHIINYLFTAFVRAKTMEPAYGTKLAKNRILSAVGAEIISGCSGSLALQPTRELDILLPLAISASANGSGDSREGVAVHKSVVESAQSSEFNFLLSSKGCRESISASKASQRAKARKKEKKRNRK